MKTSIVIQGPTNFCRDLNLLSQRKVIWSTWNNTPKEDVEYITSKGVSVLLNDYPEVNGHLNVNLQAKSTITGIRDSVDFIFKTRGDMQWINLDSIVDILEQSYRGKMMFIAYHTDANPHYIMDMFSFGSRIDSEVFWDYYNGNPDSTCPESQLLNNYINKKGWNSLKEAFENLDFFLDKLVPDKIDAYWLKYPNFKNGRKMSCADWQNIEYLKT